MNPMEYPIGITKCSWHAFALEPQESRVLLLWTTKLMKQGAEISSTHVERAMLP